MHDVSPNRLPSHHISRPRLTDPLADAQQVVIEAAGGYGKSVLAAELVDNWGALPVWVALEAGSVSARLLVARLRAAALTTGLSDAAAAIAGAGDDGAAAVDAMLFALAAESCAFVIDDAHRADAGAAALIERIAEGLRGHQRLVVAARHIPAGLARLRRAPAETLNAADLALAPDETVALCRDGFGLQTTPEDARRLDAATGGWTAAAVLAASRSARSARPLGSLVGAGSVDRDAMQWILEEALGGGDRSLFSKIAVPPLLDRELLTEITGDAGFLERALDLGLPMTQAGPTWWVLPDPVREHLAALSEPDPSVTRTAAAYYGDHGELRVALQMLLADGDGEGAAALLDRSEPWVVDSVNALELLSVLDSIPQGVLDRHPRGLLTVARCCAGSWLGAQSARLMARADAIVTAESDPRLRRAIDIERLTELLDSGDNALAESQARALLANLGAGEDLTRARTVTVIGQALCGRRDGTGRWDVEAASEAADWLRRASELQLRLGNRPAAATLTIFRAVWNELPLGRAQAALEQLDAGLELAADHPRRHVQVLFCHAHALAELGRYDEMSAELDDVAQRSRQQGDRWMVPYVAWERMFCASWQGDAEATVSHAREANAYAGSGYWWAVDGSEFLAEAADSLDRVGETALARDYLARAGNERKRAEAHIAMAECALLARHGDPALARELLRSAERHGVAPREYWRIALLDAYAAFRQADPAAGVLAARAFERAAEIGQPTAPLLRERELTESLLALASETGLPAARQLDAVSLPTAIAVLGRFELSRGGRPVALGNGQEARLLKLVAVSGPGVHVEQAIESLWPEVEPRAGRNRLRTVLNRLREAAPEVLLREGDAFIIGPDVRLDLALFNAEARSALTLHDDRTGSVAVARSAIARYRGPLLPFDPYEEWAEEPRAAAQRTMLDLLDLCAETAARQGDLDEARRMVERAIELAPYDDHRYLRVASILREQGRKGAALSVLRRARSALAQIGLDPPDALADLERQVAASTQSESQPINA